MGKINLKFKDKEYTLEYNRYSIVEMEKRGFNIEKAEERKLTTYLLLCEGAFFMHYPHMKAEEIDKIIASISNTDELFVELVKLYKEAVEAIFDKDNSDEGNATWVRA